MNRERSKQVVNRLRVKLKTMRTMQKAQAIRNGSSKQKKDAMRIHDHNLRLLMEIHKRLTRLETHFRLDSSDAIRCDIFFHRFEIREQANHNKAKAKLIGVESND